MKQNSINPFTIIFGRTVEQVIQSKINKIDDKLMKLALEEITLEHQRNGFRAQLDFINEGQKPSKEDQIRQFFKSAPTLTEEVDNSDLSYGLQEQGFWKKIRDHF